ncbi:MAG TPA: DUF952 domain-containing protein [Aestuariivirgaceae bacterium]|nr:DUF952 domain-containing protein [Aestuariivirgaceae bacterium]
MADWSASVATGTYQGSADDRRDGFIHLSAANQLPRALETHFGRRTGLVLIALEAAALGPGLKWEPSRSGALFPHVYGPLPASAALWVREIPDSGRDEFLRGLVGP